MGPLGSIELHESNVPEDPITVESSMASLHLTDTDDEPLANSEPPVAPVHRSGSRTPRPAPPPATTPLSGVFSFVSAALCAHVSQLTVCCQLWAMVRWLAVFAVIFSIFTYGLLGLPSFGDEDDYEF